MLKNSLKKNKPSCERSKVIRMNKKCYESFVRYSRHIFKTCVFRSQQQQFTIIIYYNFNCLKKLIQGNCFSMKMALGSLLISHSRPPLHVTSQEPKSALNEVNEDLSLTARCALRVTVAKRRN